MDPRTVRIRALNDELRQNLAGGVAVTTPGVAALGQEAVDRIVKTIAAFDDFCHANDPYEEHDFGSIEAEGHTIFFKIDYYDQRLNYHSPDPSDPAVTRRVITIMLADEYILGENGFLLVGRPGVAAPDTAHHFGDVAIGAVERLSLAGDSGGLGLMRDN
jgi:hypothetical protein